MTAFALALAILLSGVRVIDGDTLAYKGETIRILNIDTPERGDRARCAAERALAEQASRALRSRVQAARSINLERDGLDRYGRTLAIVRLDGRDVGEDLIAEGMRSGGGVGGRIGVGDSLERQLTLPE